jgi:hypothetical protein
MAAGRVRCWRELGDAEASGSLAVFSVAGFTPQSLILSDEHPDSWPEQLADESPNSYASSRPSEIQNATHFSFAVHV